MNWLVVNDNCSKCWQWLFFRARDFLRKMNLKMLLPVSSLRDSDQTNDFLAAKELFFQPAESETWLQERPLVPYADRKYLTLVYNKLVCNHQRPWRNAVIGHKSVLINIVLRIKAVRFNFPLLWIIIFYSQLIYLYHNCKNRIKMRTSAGFSVFTVEDHWTETSIASAFVRLKPCYCELSWSTLLVIST